MLTFGGTRTFHRIAVAIEDAGWEFRDTIMWLYGSGFPKSLDIGKSIDKLQGNEREKVVNSTICPDFPNPCKGHPAANNSLGGGIMRHATPTKGNTVWEGYGTALKPAFEPILVCMNPLDGTFANNALKHGVAGINIDECRVPYEGDVDSRTFGGEWRTDKAARNVYEGGYEGTNQTVSQKGRFPANIIHDGSQMVLDLFPDRLSSGLYKKTGKQRKSDNSYIRNWERDYNGKNTFGGEGGSAARFFKECRYSITDLCLSQSYDTMNICKNIYVATAERLLAIIQATIENTARLNVEGLQDVQSDPLVRCAGNHADTCEILTALVVAKIKTLDSNKEALQAMRDYTGNSKECTQLLNLVSSAEIKGSIDITQITISLLKSFGYVNPATTNCTHETDWIEPKRFIYTPKASKSERNRGCEDLESVKVGHNRFDTCEVCGGTIFQNPDRPSACKCENPQRENNTVKGNSHPTVKPLALMEYLCKLVKYPEYNLILDPFMGSGTTLLACIRLGIPCIGIDSDEKSCEIAAKRCEYEVMELGL
jgi:hypothetical protein